MHQFDHFIQQQLVLAATFISEAFFFFFGRISEAFLIISNKKGIQILNITGVKHPYLKHP